MTVTTWVRVSVEDAVAVTGLDGEPGAPGAPPAGAEPDGDP